MSLKNRVLPLLNLIASLRLKRAGASVCVGRESQVLLWRVRPGVDCIFRLGEQSLVSTSIVFERPGATVEIGSRTFIGGKGVFSAASRISIGSDVMLSWGCTVTDHDSHSLNYAERADDVVEYLAGRKDWTNVPIAPVSIGDKVWMGFNCSVLKGVTIGEGAVVAANSNVTKDVPPWTLVAGNPARIIRTLSATEPRNLAA